MSNIEDNSLLLIQAAADDDVVEAQRLIPISDPTFSNSEALYAATIYGHARCVELLIPVSDTNARENYGLQMAARNGHAQCVRLLVPISDPKANNSAALQMAVENGHTQCIELLYPVSDPMVALTHLQMVHPDDYNAWGQLYEMIEAERVRHTLSTEIGTSTLVKAQRKL